MALPPFEIMLAIAAVIFLAIGIHEYCHAKFADMAGDPTPRMMGRVTLDLTKHFEPMGTFMMVISSLAGVGIGWGKPVTVNPQKMNNPRWDHFYSVLAGPLSNLAQAVFWGFLLRFALLSKVVSLDQVINGLNREPGSTFFAAFLGLAVLLNLGLFLFNLIPLGLLDGHWLVGTFMPEPMRVKWYIWNHRYGVFILLALVILSQVGNLPILSAVIGPPLFFLFRLITGLPV